MKRIRNGMKWAVTAFAAGLSLDAAALAVYGLTSTSSLISFDSSSPTLTSAPLSITGLAGGDSIVGIDFRPANGLLYGLGSASNLYTIDIATGAATQIGSSGAFLLNGSAFGFDFNPVPDRIRVTSNNDQNLRLNPNNGALAGTDTMLAFAIGDPNEGVNPNVAASGYTNSFAGTTTTTLFNIDTVLNILVSQVPPNNGTLNTIGSLGVDTTDDAGFDIHFFNNQAFASLTDSNNISSFYSVNLSTGAASLIGGIGSNQLIRDIAIQQVPEPETLALMGLGLAGLIGIRRRPGAGRVAFQAA